MFADKRGKNVVDGLVVARRVLGQSFQGIDATEAHVELAVAELFDGLGATVGDLALLCSDLGLSGGVEGLGGVPQALGGEYDAADDDQAGGSLDEGVPGGVDRLQPLCGAHLLSLD
ncbi:hypothetical protein ABT120_34475 [Nonomuraea angiospora]|uniref:hypothetical protein n=1 Tax=Nonomuraea angiospora TaxID=46172 RepID=UPI00331EF316